MLYGFREREVLLDIFEEVTGLRMNHAYIRIGGVIMDLPERGHRADRARSSWTCRRASTTTSGCSTQNPIWLERNVGVGALSAEDALALGVTGPMLRAAGVAADVRKDEPYCGYETYDFEVPVRHRRRRVHAVPPAYRGDARVDEDRRVSASSASRSRAR